MLRCLGWIEAKVLRSLAQCGFDHRPIFFPLLPPERLAQIYAHFEFFRSILRLARIHGYFDQFDKSGMRVDSGLIILIAIVTALVIVALALLFYSPGWSGLTAALYITMRRHRFTYTNHF